MKLTDLNKYYDKLQLKYGDITLDAIYNGGLTNKPDICLVFMNPTKRILASNKTWKGIKAPWIGTKNIWNLFKEIDVIDEDIYNEIKSIKSNEWTYEFANKVYANITKHKVFITNLAKCTQTDARALPNEVYLKYLDLFLKEIEIVKPKVIILFGNQVSSIVLNQNISVSKYRRFKFIKNINGKDYSFYPVYYPIGNGRYNIDKAIEDINWIKKN